jgi:hypothetical protein
LNGCRNNGGRKSRFSYQPSAIAALVSQALFFQRNAVQGKKQAAMA